MGFIQLPKESRFFGYIPFLTAVSCEFPLEVVFKDQKWDRALACLNALAQSFHGLGHIGILVGSVWLRIGAPSSAWLLSPTSGI